MNNNDLLTGELFGKLFSAFDRENFIRSVYLFKQRFEENNFDLNYFKDKKCLDVGCGGGRYSIALSLLGASEVIGVDISTTSIEYARKIALELNVNNVHFINVSGENLPFPDSSFDFIVFSGVLMHMEDPEKGISEISRVLSKGGMMYMLVYATGGVRWPLINILRTFSNEIGFHNFDKALSFSGYLDVNKRRTYLDDLFVPNIDFYTEKRLIKLLMSNGFYNIERWTKGRLDHEENLNSYYEDIQKLYFLFETGEKMKDYFSESICHLFKNGAQIIKSCLDFISYIIQLVDKGLLTEEKAREIVIGQGHHRLIASKK